MANATKIIKDWCASCGMPEPSDGECHALTVALAATTAAEGSVSNATFAAAPVALPEPDDYKQEIDSENCMESSHSTGAREPLSRQQRGSET